MTTSRDNFRKNKELEELRKLGVAPPAEDENGFYINPHIPAYMKDAPWYVNKGTASLAHQRLGQTNHDVKPIVDIHHVIKKGRKKHNRRKWVKGACENCGALTHKKNNCLERPRKKKAKFTHRNIADDDIIVKNVNHSWQSKRDGWANYDVNRHQLEVHKWTKIENIRP
eukprot:UN31480